MKRRGVALVLSSPSGAGKTTIAKRLLASESNVSLSVSMTTRPQRPQEVEGRDYHFVSLPTFKKVLKEGNLLEHADIFSYLYGTPRGPVEDKLSRGEDVVFDVDWQGLVQLRQAIGPDLAPVLILPPSMKELERRLRSRGAKKIELRLAKAQEAMQPSHLYEWVVENRDLDESVENVRAILRAERLKLRRHINFTPPF